MADIICNDVCERAIQHFHETGEVLPEVLALRRELLKEVIDGVPESEVGLLKALRLQKQMS